MEKVHSNQLEIETEKTPQELSFWQNKFNYFTIESIRLTVAPIIRVIINFIFPVSNDPLQLTNTDDSLTEEEQFLKKHHL
jgi:hypothetical protein